VPERIAESLCELIGQTPLVRLGRFAAEGLTAGRKRTKNFR
jgi:hypothetical protein